MSLTSSVGARRAVQSRRLIIDANILIRAVLGVRVRELIERYCESVAFYVAESNVEEAMQYLAELAPRRGIGDPTWQAALTSIMTAVQIIPQVELATAENEALARSRAPFPQALAESLVWPDGRKAYYRTWTVEK